MLRARRDAREHALGLGRGLRYLAPMPSTRTLRRRALAALACASIVTCTSCTRSPESWAAQFASNDPYERELAAAALGRLPRENARWTMHNLLRRLSDPDTRVRERLLAAIDAQVEYAPLAFARGFATADCGDPDVARRMDALARTHAQALAPAALVLLDEREPSAADRLLHLLLDSDPALLDATIAAGGERAVRAHELRERWRTARGVR